MKYPMVIAMAGLASLGLALAAPAQVRGPEATPDPIPGSIAADTLEVALVDVARIPVTPGRLPQTRINYLHHAGDGSGRLFVNDMRGQIFIIANGVVLPEPFIDVAAKTGPGFLTREFELGLGCFAFHPEYARAGAPGFGKFYTVHTASADAVTPTPATIPLGRAGRRVQHFDVITEWSVSPDDPDRADPRTGREVLRIAQPWQDHNTGQLAFNPNARPGDADFGLLYIGVGDGGDTLKYGFGVDEDRQAQNPGTPLGAVLRIDPLERAGRSYTIPDDNPLRGRADALPEIWAFGLRNPQRFSWDAGGSGSMLIADIGQLHVEEINLGKAGGNYGWSDSEGSFVLDRTNAARLFQTAMGRPGAIDPVAQYDHDEGHAVTGGFVYRGNAVPELAGMYIFGDIVNGRLFYVEQENLRPGRQASIRELTTVRNGLRMSLLEIMGGPARADLRFGIDEQGEIYVLTKQDGAVRRIASTAVGASPLQQTKNARAGASRRDPPAPAHTARDDVPAPYWWAAAGIGIVLIGAGTLLYRRRAAGPAALDGGTRRPRDPRLRSLVKGGYLEIDAGGDAIVFSTRELHERRRIETADIAYFAIAANGREVLRLANGGRFGAETESRLRAAVHEFAQAESDPDSMRRIDISVVCREGAGDPLSVNFYLRSGDQRLTELSFAETIEEIVVWCRRLDTEMGDSQGPGRASSGADYGSDPREEAPDSGMAATPSGGHSSLADELARLGALHDRGFLTEEEFGEAKARILKR